MGSSDRGAGPDLAALVFEAGLFDAGWYGATHADVALSGLGAEAHFRQFGLSLRRLPCPDLADRLAPDFPQVPSRAVLSDSARAALQRHFFPPVAPRISAASLVAAGTPPEFDADFYLRSNPDIDLSRSSGPYEHFLRWGWRRFRNPAPDFDLAWYALSHGHEFARPDENPFLHYLRSGKAQGHAGCPPAEVRLDHAAARPLPAAPRRACLFAAYDPALRIDDYVLIFLRELARHADVFYLADCDMPASELARLEGIVTGAWAQRHGAYDFGSYSRLARDLVGWDRLAEYDEVLFVNDSCYLLRPLDEVLDTMAARPCAWWGMQVTKGLAITRDSQPFPAPGDTLPVAALDAAMLGRFEREPVYDLHMGSYFMAFRRPVLTDPRFRRALDGARPEPNKFTIIRKYEVGLTRLLIGAGHVFDTWAPVITRRHPVYTDVIFDLIRDGFPLFKRYLVSDNPYRVPALALWPLVLEAGAPLLTPLPVIEANLRRLAHDDRLQANLAVTEEGAPPPEPLTPEAFAAADRAAPKFDHVWGFATGPDPRGLCGDARALLEAVKGDPTLTKIVFTRGCPLPTSLMDRAVNLRAVPLASAEGQALLMRCGRVFVADDAGAELDWPLVEAGRRICRLGGQVPPPGGRAADLAVCAAPVDHLLLGASHPGLEVWQTGLPRHDLIGADMADLPADLRAQGADLAARLAGRGLVLLALAPRGPQDAAALRLTAHQARQICDWIGAQGLVLGLWEGAAQAELPELAGPHVLKLPPAAFPETAILCRAARMVVTDRPDLARDAVQAGAAVIRLPAPEAASRPDPAAILPDPGVMDAAGLLRALAAALADKDPDRAARQTLLRGPADGQNCARLLRHLRPDRAAPRRDPARIVLLSGARPETARLAPWLGALPGNPRMLAAETARPGDLSDAGLLLLDRPQWSPGWFDLVEAARAGGARILCDVSDREHDFRARVREMGLAEARPRANAIHAAAAARAEAMAMADAFLAASPDLAGSLAGFGRPVMRVAGAEDLAAVLRDGGMP